jgi:hypothetical protein
LVLENKWMSANDGFTLGNLLTVGAGSSKAAISHEYGHYIQSRRSGVGYLFGFAIPSITRAGLWGMGIVGGDYDSLRRKKCH